MPGEAGPPLLEVVGLSARRRGLPPISGIDLTAAAGAVTALIGPTGAGRATLASALTGKATVEQGEIRLDGRSLRGAGARARSEIVRVPTGGDLLPGASLFEATALAYALAQRSAWARLRRPWAAVGARGRREVMLLLDRTGLAALADHPVTGLPLWHCRRLQLALALAGRPRLLILDRPWRGLPSSERHEHADLLRSLCDDHLAVLLIEDDLGLVAELARSVVVLRHGRRVAQGSPAEVGGMGEVRRIFVGEAA